MLPRQICHNIPFNFVNSKFERKSKTNGPPSSLFLLLGGNINLKWIFFTLLWYSWRRNRPFQSCLFPRRQNESSCKTILMKMCFFLYSHFHANQTHFQVKNFAARLSWNRGKWQPRSGLFIDKNERSNDSKIRFTRSQALGRLQNNWI